MKDRLILFGYFCVVVLVTMLHDLLPLFLFLAGAVIIAGREAPSIAKRSLLAILLFNSVVTLSYASLALYQGEFSSHYVLLLNLRVFLLTFLTFLLGRKFNPFRAFVFSRTLQYLLTLSYSQVMNFRRTFHDFRLALRSRLPARPRMRDLNRHGAAVISYFLDKSMHNAVTITQALKSRGFFND